jgi:hypothetical protein
MVSGLLMELDDHNCWTIAVIPPPRRDRPHRLHWSTWRRRHQHRARQAHRRWNAYAETTP